MVADRERPRGRPLLVGVLLALATVFFVWGAFAEQSGHQERSASHASPTSERAGTGETAEQRASEGGSASAGSAETTAEAEYRPFGINLESDALIVIGALVSLVVAALVTFRPDRASFAAVVIVAVAFTALEVAEVIHQADVDEPGLVALAAIAGILHATAGLLATIGLVAAGPAPEPLTTA